jgi:hypothetical protein
LFRILKFHQDRTLFNLLPFGEANGFEGRGDFGPYVNGFIGQRVAQRLGGQWERLEQGFGDNDAGNTCGRLCQCLSRRQQGTRQANNDDC